MSVINPRPFHTLRHRDFRGLWLGNLVSLTGSQMQVVAINWHIYQLTGSPLMLGITGLVRVLPIIFFSLLGGVAADRYDRRKLMLATQIVMTIAAACLAWFTWHGTETAGLIFLLTAISAGATAFDNPARQSLIPRLVPEAELPGALAMNLTMFHAAMIGGPGLAGLLIMMAGSGEGAGMHALLTPSAATLAAAGASKSTTGLYLIYLLNALSFLGVIVALLTMRTSGKVLMEGGGEHPHPWQSLREGLRFVFSTPIMVWTMALDFFATFFSGALTLLPIVTLHILHAGPVAYGWLAAAPALGALVGSLGTAFFPLPKAQGKIFLLSVAAYGAATIIFGLSPWFWLTFTALAAAGFADLISTVIRQTLRQLITPDALRGRMTSVNMIFFMGGPQLGELEAGFVASLFASAALGASVSIVSGGIATLAVVGFIAWRAPLVRNYTATH